MRDRVADHRGCDSDGARTIQRVRGSSARQSPQQVQPESDSSQLGPATPDPFSASSGYFAPRANVRVCMKPPSPAACAACGGGKGLSVHQAERGLRNQRDGVPLPKPQAFAQRAAKPLCPKFSHKLRRRGVASPGRPGRLPLLPQYVGVGRKKTTNACTFFLTWLICGVTFLFALSGADALGRNERGCL